MNNATITGQQAEQAAEDIRRALTQLAQDAGFQTGNSEKRHRALSEFLSRHPNVELAYMVDPKGVQDVPNAVPTGMRVAYDGDGLGEDRSDRAWYKLAMHFGGPYITRRYVSVATHALCITVSVPLYKEDGSPLGVVAADLRVN